MREDEDVLQNAEEPPRPQQQQQQQQQQQPPHPGIANTSLLHSFDTKESVEEQDDREPVVPALRPDSALTDNYQRSSSPATVNCSTNTAAAATAKTEEIIKQLQDECRILRDNEAKLKHQLTESQRRERIVMRRLDAKEQELHDYVSQISELKAAQAPSAVTLKSMVLDPAVNILYQKMHTELRATQAKLEETQNELSAWKFTPDSNTGKRLMAKCRLLYQENEELGKMTSNGRLAKLENDLSLQKRLGEEMTKSHNDLEEVLLELEDDIEGMQNTILLMQNELQLSGERIAALERDKQLVLMQKCNHHHHHNRVHENGDVSPESGKMSPVVTTSTTGGSSSGCSTVDVVVPPSSGAVASVSANGNSVEAAFASSLPVVKKDGEESAVNNNNNNNMNHHIRVGNPDSIDGPSNTNNNNNSSSSNNNNSNNNTTSEVLLSNGSRKRTHSPVPAGADDCYNAMIEPNPALIERGEPIIASTDRVEPVSLRKRTRAAQDSGVVVNARTKLRSSAKNKDESVTQAEAADDCSSLKLIKTSCDGANDRNDSAAGGGAGGDPLELNEAATAASLVAVEPVATKLSNAKVDNGETTLAESQPSNV